VSNILEAMTFSSDSRQCPLGGGGVQGRFTTAVSTALRIGNWIGAGGRAEDYAGFHGLSSQLPVKTARGALKRSQGAAIIEWSSQRQQGVDVARAALKPLDQEPRRDVGGGGSARAGVADGLQPRGGVERMQEEGGFSLHVLPCFVHDPGLPRVQISLQDLQVDGKGSGVYIACLKSY